MLIPQPPFDMVIDKGYELWITGIIGLCAVVALLFSLEHWRRSGRPVVLLMLLSGGAMMVFEPLVDTVGGCWFPENSWIAYSAWGRPIPVWLCLTYFFYFGIGAGLLWIAMKRGMTGKQIWLAFAGAMLGDLVLETVLLMFDPYIYYGYQPLLLGKFPLWWAAVNGLVPFVFVALVCRLDSFFKGWRYLTIVPIALTASVSANAAAGWPSWTVINTDWGWLASQIGGLLTFVLAFWIMQVIIGVVAIDRKSAIPVQAVSA